MQRIIPNAERMPTAQSGTSVPFAEIVEFRRKLVFAERPRRKWESMVLGVKN